MSTPNLKRFFTSVTRRYDLLNRLFTFGLDERWRRAAALEILRGRPRRVLDLCCGTGDLTVRLARAADNGSQILGADFSRPMLAAAERKLARAKPRPGVELVEADAANLPFDDATFDAVGIAFAFRNLTWHNPRRDVFLSEMLRVLAPGGKLVIVESSQPPSRLVRVGAHFYSRRVVPLLGSVISGERAAYRYLGKSAAEFYSADEVCTLLIDAGFSRASYDRLLSGVAAVHVALR